MKLPLIELVDEIIRRIQERPEAVPSEKGIRSWLARKGYGKREIDAAMKLVGPRVCSLTETAKQLPSTIRLLSVYEEYKLTTEARNALARLELYGMIDPYEREMILDYLNHFEGEVGLDELDYLLSWMVCSGRDVGFQQALYNVFEGKQDTLH
jgi:uncharacterized protein Smg (DUF494 family)